MAKGDPYPSPWMAVFNDNTGLFIRITIPFDNTTKAILDGGVIHRDPGCRWTRIVWGVPSDGAAKRSPAVPVGDTAFTAAQVLAFSGFSTINDILALQVTAE
jgi:hypothetical protein